jgi:hypothetical protein
MSNKKIVYMAEYFVTQEEIDRIGLENVHKELIERDLPNFKNHECWIVQDDIKEPPHPSIGALTKGSFDDV